VRPVGRWRRRISLSHERLYAVDAKVRLIDSGVPEDKPALPGIRVCGDGQRHGTIVAAPFHRPSQDGLNVGGDAESAHAAPVRGRRDAENERESSVSAGDDAETQSKADKIRPLISASCDLQWLLFYDDRAVV
jgi:hypothetical protein